MIKLREIALLAGLALFMSAPIHAEPSLGRDSGGSGGTPCIEDWVSYSVIDGAVGEADSVTGLFVYETLDLDESDASVDGTTSGMACFEWGNVTTEFKLRHLCESARWTVYWQFNGNLTGAGDAVLGLALHSAESDTLTTGDQIPSLTSVELFAGLGATKRSSSGITSGGIVLNENTRIGMGIVNLVVGLTQWELRSGTKIIFTTERCFS